MIRSTSANIAGRGIVAGAAGGIAEILWILVYATATGTDAATLARGITTAVGANLIFTNGSVTTGVAVHMVLAVTLGVALAFTWTYFSRHWARQMSPYVLVTVALAAVWVVNFLFVLPLLSPDFVQIVPYPISLASKLLFGLAASAVLSHKALRSTTKLAITIK